MLSITPTLLDAQRQASSQPYVRAVFSDASGDRARYRFARLYAGAEDEYYSAVTGAADGSLVRARIDPSTKVLYTQRAASPGPGSVFSAWASLGVVSAAGAVTLTADATDVSLFYIDTDTVTIRVRRSSDNGASFGSPSTVATASSAVSFLAATASPAGDYLLFWTEGAAVWTSRYSGGSWSAAASWSNSVASISGLAASYLLDWGVIVCGAEAGSLDPKVWACIYGDGVNQPADTWSGLAEVTTATAGSNVSYQSPALALLEHWRLFFVEKYTRAQAYSRLYGSTMSIEATLNEERWSEPAAFDYPTAGSGQPTADYGVAAAAENLGGSIWLSAAAGVWVASADTNPELDVTADVAEVSINLTERDGRVRLVLRNDPDTSPAPAGRYSAYGSGALGALQRGTRLQLSLGYYTAVGAESAAPQSYWIESIEQTTGPEARLIIQARDVWWLLEQWRARRQFVWPLGSLAISQILQIICARAGIDFGSAGVSAALTALQPAFTIQSGESGKTAIARLLAMAPDQAYGQSARLLAREPAAGDPVDYEYGRGHSIVQARYRDVGPDVNRVRVLGAAVFNEGFDFAEIDSVGERIGQVLDLNLSTTADAADRAAFGLRGAELHGRADELRVFGVNCGQEMYDVVSISDPQAGLDAAKRRVLGISWRFSTGKTPAYDMTLLLGAP